MKRLYAYATYGFFQPITSRGQERTIKELKIFDGVRKPYDSSYKGLSELECNTIINKLAIIWNKDLIGGFRYGEMVL